MYIGSSILDQGNTRAGCFIWGKRCLTNECVSNRVADVFRRVCHGCESEHFKYFSDGNGHHPQPCCSEMGIFLLPFFLGIAQGFSVNSLLPHPSLLKWNTSCKNPFHSLHPPWHQFSLRNQPGGLLTSLWMSHCPYSERCSELEQIGVQVLLSQILKDWVGQPTCSRIFSLCLLELPYRVVVPRMK